MAPSRRLLFAALLCVGLTAAVYAPVGRFGFVELDDPYYVYANADLATLRGTAAVRYAATTTLGGNWQPLVWLSFFADRALWHLSPGPMHVENVALHAASAVLVLVLLADATGSVGRSAACAALFAVHPLHVESVAWVSERKDTLSTVWLLAAVCCYVRFVRGRGVAAVPKGRSSADRRASLRDSRYAGMRRGWYAAMVACHALSLSAKSMGVTLPAVLLLLDGWPLDRLRGAVWPRVREKVPLIAMAAAAAVGAVLAQRSVGAMAAVDTTAAGRTGNAAVAVVRYLLDTAWPARLAAFYPYRPVPPTAAVAAAAAVSGITVLAVRARRRRPYVLVGWLWFCGTLLPVSGLLVQVGMQSRADRYTYFPSVGLSVAVVWLAADVLPFAPAIATAVVVALAVVARRQVDTWRDNETVFAHAAAVTDDNYLAEDELGREAMRRGDLAAAVDHLRRAIEDRDDFATAHADLGRCAIAVGRPDLAAAEFARAVRLAPGVASYRDGLAAAQQGRPQR